MHYSPLLSGLLLSALAPTALAAVANGDFEQWINGSPDHWSVIDSGITVTDTFQPLFSGSRAAALNVTTTTQSATDFRQSVAVQAGQQYDFSVRVYHTEGHVAARLYVDGYQNYTNPAITGEWQQLSHSYTASSDGNIEVGLRFYDQTGFDGQELVYIDDFAPASNSDGDNGGSGDNGSGGLDNISSYYQSAEGLTGYALKTELYNIINSHNDQSYSALWTFYINNERDTYYEQDSSILDVYSENPAANDPYTYSAGNDQCGTYRGEGDCYNREHAFPRSWFGGAVAPMNTDVHHIFPTDGYVNAKRSSYPYGEVSSASYTSANGSKLGSAKTELGYNGTVFEPIDEFKGDIARAYFYMATRYQNVIAGWENNSSYGDAVLDGSSDKVYEDWFLSMLVDWHQQDPVSQKERDRNDAAYTFQGNRNPFVDYPQFVHEIWGQ